MKLECSRKIFETKILKYQITLKIHRVGAELFLVDGGQTDITKLRVDLSNFSKAPKKIDILPISSILTEHLIKKNISFIRNYISESYASPYPTLQYSVYPLWCDVLRINPFQSNFFANRILSSAYLFGRERGWWITCNYPIVLKEKNIEKQKEYNLRYLLANVRNT
jgi:hypothetical protein